MSTIKTILLPFLLLVAVILFLSGCASDTKQVRNVLLEPTPTPELLIAPKNIPTLIPVGADFWITITAQVLAHDLRVSRTPEVHTPQNIQSTKAPTKCNIKGNVSSNGRFYHCPNFPQYDRIKINANEGDKLFCSEQEAISAGFESGAKGYGCLQ